MIEDYICAICFFEQATSAFFPKHCGHYMVEKLEWERHKDLWLISREYELSFLPPDVRSALLEKGAQNASDAGTIEGV